MLRTSSVMMHAGLVTERRTEYPPLRTFHPRQRGLSAARAAQFEERKTRFALDVHGPLLDLDVLFGAGAEVWLDIGCGGGEGLIEMAAQHTEQCLIAAEVHTPGVAAVVEAIDVNDWSHVRVVHGDALEFVARVPPGSLAGVRIWFPDPWPKPRQRKRRLVSEPIVGRLVDRLNIGGVLHLATDVADYAQQIAAVCAADVRLAGGEVARPSWRPLTRYERRGRDEGRVATDFLYTRVS
jgi:tRNA (guanine-N7-)-methyltransferase